MDNPDAWVEIAEYLNGAVRTHLEKINDRQNEYDDCDEPSVTESMVLDFIMNPKNRFDLNDIICDSIETWLKHAKKRK
jgi:hypothetical protein